MLLGHCFGGVGGISKCDLYEADLAERDRVVMSSFWVAAFG